MQHLFKIIVGIAVAYFISFFIGGRIFLMNTPHINEQYIASLRETPSRVGVFITSLASFLQKDNTQKEIERFKTETGSTEVAVSDTDKQKLIDSTSLVENPQPDALFNYVSKGVAASKPSTQGETVLRLDEQTQQNLEYKRFVRPDGTVLDILILK